MRTIDIKEQPTITTDAAAKRLGVIRRRVQKMILDGTLAAEKRGRDYLIKESDLKALEEARKERQKEIEANRERRRPKGQGSTS